MTEHNKTYPSTSNYYINLLCLGAFFMVVGILPVFYPSLTPTQLTLLGLGATAIPLWIYDLFRIKVHLRPATELNFTVNNVDNQRLTTKLIGLFFTYICILALYYIIPFYQRPFYQPFFYGLRLGSPWVILLSLIYFRFLDPKQNDPYDSYWHVGCLATGRWKNVNRSTITEHIRVWFIKGFFTPIMFCLLTKYVDHILSIGSLNNLNSFFKLYEFLLVSFFCIDVIYGALGYVFTLRILDTHIRSTEPTVLGWLVCLMCYAPFYNVIGIGLFKYEDDFLWYHWLAFSPIFYYALGIFILFSLALYAMGTVAFGYRMSNLTYRGIITSGPYRYTKHPAYIGKVLGWWMISLPLLSLEGPATAFKHTLYFIAIAGIYYLRAITEENHLSNYPEYVKYANWINDNGIFRPLTKLIPSLKYSESKAKRWNSIVWFKKTD